MKTLSSIVLVAWLAVPLLSQEFRSTISGRVLDSQSAAILGAKIVARHLETGALFPTTSGATGQYVLPFLPPGPYSVTAEATGFKRFVREGVLVSANERVQLDVSLEVGDLNQAVTVTADAPMLETATGSSGQAIKTLQIENMPLNGRTPVVLAQLSYGVIPKNDPRNVRPFDNAGPSDLSMGGAPSRENELLIDGAPNTKSGQVAYNPPVDAVQEVKVETFQADAGYGHTGGGTVNVVLKSGTNDLHGTAYWFNQSSTFAATPFFTNRAGQEKEDPLYHQYGANAGGPIVIPKVLNGRNRAFFYFAFEGMKNDRPAPTTTSVPTPEQRTGDFSALLNAGSKYQIYDPMTGVREGSRVRRQPFAGNIIPAHRISAIAKNYLPYYPAPNQPGLIDGQNNYLAAVVEGNSFDNELGRVDLNLSDRHKFFASFRRNKRDIDAKNTFRNSAQGERSARKNWGATIDDVYTLSPTTLLNTRLNWTRYTVRIGQSSDGMDMTELGFPASLASQATKAMMPSIDLNRYNDLGHNQGSDSPADNFQLFSSLTRVAGSHTLKAGGDVRLIRNHITDFKNGSGQYTFRSQWTGGPYDNSSASPMGQDLAAFLLGLPSSGTMDVRAAASDQTAYYALFLQDDYRASSNLTINLGLRYERDLPLTERYNRAVRGFDLTTPSPVAAAARSAYQNSPIPELPVSQFDPRGGLLFANPSQRSLYDTGAQYFSPRFGFAWKPRNKTVIRGGTGVFVFPVNASYDQAGFTAKTPLVATLDGWLTPAATLENPFPNGIQQPVGSSLGIATDLGQGVSYHGLRALNPYSVRWNLNVQREIAKDLLIEVGYVGNHAVHLDTSRELNAIPREWLSTSPVRDNSRIDLLTGNVANPFASLLPGTELDGSKVQRNQLLRPFPHFTSVAQKSYLNNGSSYFHMLQVRVEKRYSNGLQFLANYAWSRLIDQTSLLNDTDPHFEKVVAGEDRPQRFVASASYELPFARRNRWLGGWIINGIYTRQSGAALGWGNVIYYGGDLNLNPRAIDGAFDVTRFNRVSSEQLDFNIRTFPSRFANLRGDGPNNIDLSVIKNFRIAERFSVQYRCEAFNAFNHPAFKDPNTSPTSSSFSRITSQANLPRAIQMAIRLKW